MVCILGVNDTVQIQTYDFTLDDTMLSGIMQGDIYLSFHGIDPSMKQRNFKTGFFNADSFTGILSRFADLRKGKEVSYENTDTTGSTTNYGGGQLDSLRTGTYNNYTGALMDGKITSYLYDQFQFRDSLRVYFKNIPVLVK